MLTPVALAPVAHLCAVPPELSPHPSVFRCRAGGDTLNKPEPWRASRPRSLLLLHPHTSNPSSLPSPGSRGSMRQHAGVSRDLAIQLWRARHRRRPLPVPCDIPKPRARGMRPNVSADARANPSSSAPAELGAMTAWVRRHNLIKWCPVTMDPPVVHSPRPPAPGPSVSYCAPVDAIWARYLYHIRFSGLPKRYRLNRTNHSRSAHVTTPQTYCHTICSHG